MRKLLASTVLFSTLLIPASSFALEGIGPRVTVTGTVKQVTITEKQKFEEEGGEFTITASNGQEVTVILDKYTKIISEGKLSRKELLPVNVLEGMQIRVRGWRVGSDTVTASLIVILNLELNPTLSVNGVIQSVDGGQVTVLAADGSVRSYTVSAESEVALNYTLRGAEALTLVGKQALITLNPLDSTKVRIMRVNGNPDPVRTKPTSVDLRMR